MRHKLRRGFSLVELLIVIGIIAALIAILLPALSAAREHARRVACISNIRQLDVAWLMYANDHHGHFCSSETQNLDQNNRYNYSIAGVTPQPGFWSWIGFAGTQHAITSGMLSPYIKDINVFACPDNPVLPNTSYAINGVLAGRIPLTGPNSMPISTGSNPRTMLTLSELKHTDRLFVFIEAMGHNEDGDGDFDGDDLGIIAKVLQGGFGTPIYPGRVSQCPGLFHGRNGSNGCTVAFADGHAIFWQYAAAPSEEFATAKIKLPAPDLDQLRAWSGGPVPPGITS